MRSAQYNKYLSLPVLLLAAAAGMSLPAPVQADACRGDDSGLTLPPGFCATIFADEIGHARHLVVSPSGVVYVNTWSGVYYGNDTPHAGGFLVALQDALFGPPGKAHVEKPFHATAVEVGKP